MNMGGLSNIDFGRMIGGYATTSMELDKQAKDDAYRNSQLQLQQNQETRNQGTFEQQQAAYQRQAGQQARADSAMDAGRRVAALKKKLADNPNMAPDDDMWGEAQGLYNDHPGLQDGKNMGLLDVDGAHTVVHGTPGAKDAVMVPATRAALLDGLSLAEKHLAQELAMASPEAYMQWQKQQQEGGFKERELSTQERKAAADAAYSTGHLQNETSLTPAHMALLQAQTRDADALARSRDADAGWRKAQVEARGNASQQGGLKPTEVIAAHDNAGKRLEAAYNGGLQQSDPEMFKKIKEDYLRMGVLKNQVLTGETGQGARTIDPYANKQPMATAQAQQPAESSRASGLRAQIQSELDKPVSMEPAGTNWMGKKQYAATYADGARKLVSGDDAYRMNILLGK